MKLKNCISVHKIHLELTHVLNTSIGYYSRFDYLDIKIRLHIRNRFHKNLALIYPLNYFYKNEVMPPTE